MFWELAAVSSMRFFTVKVTEPGSESIVVWISLTETEGDHPA